MSNEEKFAALYVDQPDGKYEARLVDLKASDLPEGDVVVDVEYSGINYKDALAVTGEGKIIREFPFIPGIDFSGTVRESNVSGFSKGDAVLANGCGIGEKVFGGFSQRVRIPADLLYRIPAGMTTQSVMKAGTAGFTAAMSVMEIENGRLPDHGDLVVTGASGGVGGYAVAMLSGTGRKVVAVSRAEAESYLVGLGAAEVVSRSLMVEDSRPLERQKWAAGVDAVGGKILSRILAETYYGGIVTCCGLAAGPSLETTVMPFILRGVRLIGIESVAYPADRRMQVWERLAQDAARIEGIKSEVVSLRDVPARCKDVLEGSFEGRFVVDLNG